MVRRKKTTIFLDAKESTTVLELKKMIEGITKKGPSEQQLYNKDDAGAGYFYIRAEGGGGGWDPVSSYYHLVDQITGKLWYIVDIQLFPENRSLLN